MAWVPETRREVTKPSDPVVGGTTIVLNIQLGLVVVC